MSAIYLVRHGQASWGSDDYDQLSDLGTRQGTWLGTAWESVDWMPTHAVAGGMKRHAQTAIATLDAAGPSDGYDVDTGWDEFDHVGLADGHRKDAVRSDPKAFQKILNEALVRWADDDGEFSETYRAFVDRVMGAFDRVATGLGRGEAVAVFTSGGPISLVSSYLIAGDDSIWRSLNNVVVNSGVTKIIVGSSGRNVVTFNEHAHLPADAITYR